jgi:hypothetical protein
MIPGRIALSLLSMGTIPSGSHKLLLPVFAISPGLTAVAAAAFGFGNPSRSTKRKSRRPHRSHRVQVDGERPMAIGLKLKRG